MVVKICQLQKGPISTAHQVGQPSHVKMVMLSGDYNAVVGSGSGNTTTALMQVK